jgi:hypothetical protein
MTEYVAMRAAFAILMAGLAPLAANWPRWRGPRGLGVSSESSLPVA